jgi:hypothetical protein
MRLTLLSLRHRATICSYLARKEHALAAYGFENIYIWRSLYQIFWAILDDSLCIFFKDSTGCFLYLPPLGAKPSRTVLDSAFAAMDSCNKNTRISRIENIEESDIAFYRQAGYACSEKFPEYLCSSQQVASLKGNAFKSQRALYNYFTKHNESVFLPYSSPFKNACFNLYRRWMNTFKSFNRDPVYQGMLRDSFASLKILLDHFSALQATGRMVIINNEVKAFTFGFRISKHTFCILYEVADLSVKGISQYIFARFCRELQGFSFINIMDDSGLENLKRVKVSLRPVKIAKSFIASRE